MQNYFIIYNNHDNINYKDYSSEKHKSNLYNKFKKKKKYIACNYNWKVFYSDDEDNNDIESNKNTNVKNGIKRKYSQSSISIYRENLHKKSTIDRTDDTSKNLNNITKTPTKKVRFLDGENLVKYINVESYKKYNSTNTKDNPYLLQNMDDKIDLKCTCFIF